MPQIKEYQKQCIVRPVWVLSWAPFTCSPAPANSQENQAILRFPGVDLVATGGLCVRAADGAARDGGQHRVVSGGAKRAVVHAGMDRRGRWPSCRAGLPRFHAIRLRLPLPTAE